MRQGGRDTPLRADKEEDMMSNPDLIRELESACVQPMDIMRSSS
jgi:hypothetical protein